VVVAGEAVVVLDQDPVVEVEVVVVVEVVEEEVVEEEVVVVLDLL
jgi:hypothetical protein